MFDCLFVLIGFQKVEQSSRETSEGSGKPSFLSRLFSGSSSPIESSRFWKILGYKTFEVLSEDRKTTRYIDKKAFFKKVSKDANVLPFQVKEAFSRVLKKDSLSTLESIEQGINEILRSEKRELEKKRPQNLDLTLELIKEKVKTFYTNTSDDQGSLTSLLQNMDQISTDQESLRFLSLFLDKLKENMLVFSEETNESICSEKTGSYEESQDPDSKVEDLSNTCEKENPSSSNTLDPRKILEEAITKFSSKDLSFKEKRKYVNKLLKVQFNESMNCRVYLGYKVEKKADEQVDRVTPVYEEGILRLKNNDKVSDSGPRGIGDELSVYNQTKQFCRTTIHSGMIGTADRATIATLKDSDVANVVNEKLQFAIHEAKPDLFFKLQPVLFKFWFSGPDQLSDIESLKNRVGDINASEAARIKEFLLLKIDAVLRDRRIRFFCDGFKSNKLNVKDLYENIRERLTFIKSDLNIERELDFLASRIVDLMVEGESYDKASLNESIETTLNSGIDLLSQALDQVFENPEFKAGMEVWLSIRNSRLKDGTPN